MVAGLSNFILFWSNSSKCWLSAGSIKIRGRVVFSQRQWYWFWNHSIYCVVFLLKLSTEKLGILIYTYQSGLSLNYPCICLALANLAVLYFFILWIALIRWQTHFAKHSCFCIFLLITATFSLSMKAITVFCTFSLAVRWFASPNFSHNTARETRLPYQATKC